jgi:hypothetical protein
MQYNPLYVFYHTRNISPGIKLDILEFLNWRTFKTLIAVVMNIRLF